VEFFSPGKPGSSLSPNREIARIARINSSARLADSMKAVCRAGEGRPSKASSNLTHPRHLNEIFFDTL
jgi:hypothetical protein